MRVISGLYRRRTISAPNGTEITRPTSDRVKESLFNILAPEIEGVKILDLFAGSGAIGIEALSRGAQYAVFVENNKYAINSLQQNLKSLKIPLQHFLVIQNSVVDFLTSAKKIKDTFDVIFADPPYDTDWYSNALGMLENSGYCAQDCLFVLERRVKHKSQKHSDAPFIPENWALQDVRKYGKTELEFWRRNYDQTINRTA